MQSKSNTLGLKIRIHANPIEGNSYFRVQNSGGNWLGPDGIYPDNIGTQEFRELTHFIFGQ